MSTPYSGWGRVLAGSGPIARPQTMMGFERGAGPVLGGRRSYGDACVTDGPGRESLALDRVLSFDRDAGVICVEAGLTLTELTQISQSAGWLPPVLPGTGFATVGGAIAMDVHGKNHHEQGTFGAHVTALTLATAEGVQKLTPADDLLWRATIGGLGQTGAILDATVQLLASDATRMRVEERRVPDWDSHLEAVATSTAPYCVSWIDATAQGARLGRGILEEATLSGHMRPRPKRPKRVPILAPNWALSSPIVRSFNALYYARIPASGRIRKRAMAEVFHPLDGIHDWNLLYGRRGFHQFQCVVGMDAAPALRDMLAAIASAGVASPLAVLKRMGPGRAGMLSFPMEGLTLAVDMPASAAATSLAKRLNAMTLEAGGRIYLAKDSTATPDQVARMYPELDAWAEVAARCDPTGALATNMVRRLALREVT